MEHRPSDRLLLALARGVDAEVFGDTVQRTTPREDDTAWRAQLKPALSNPDTARMLDELADRLCE